MTRVATPVNSPTLPGYTFVETIYQGNRTTVYRAVETDTQQPVVIKALAQAYPSFAALVQFRNQYTVTKNLPISGIVRPLSLAACGNGYALVMEAFEGIDLGQYIKQHRLTLTEILGIAIQLTDILHDLCKHRVIHKDIKPSNILIHAETKQIKLIDFGIASLLPRACQEIQNLGDLEGALAYLAPEQTGRMNRGIDYRADFYALGVTLYELLTGQVPFQSEDPMALLHCHLAKMPVLPHNVDAQIPVLVSAIVMKLMAKNAEGRYQHALGLKHDLQQCLRQLQMSGQIEAFELGQVDRCDRFLIPEKLYGRGAEVTALLAAFERVSQGNSELMLVAGFSGVGKTAVINEVHKPIVKQRGYFIQGKFDQFNRNIPFSAFVQAFRNLVGQLLSESNADLQVWKIEILTALGENAKVIIDLIPELETILGPQPAVAELAGTAAQNRFSLLFGKFIEVFTTPDHPLVIFLDDLQWADSASLTLLKLLMTSAKSACLLVLGAYRDNEVSPTHPLMLTLDEIQQPSKSLHTLTLGPLKQTDIHQLVAESLHCSVEIAVPLAQLVYQKAQGNPFFTTQFLKGLEADGLISFNDDVAHWQCDLGHIRSLALTDDVVDFMVKRLRQLPQATQTILKMAACLGNQFDLKTLATVHQQSPEDVASGLWPVLQVGLVIPENETYKFFQGLQDQLTTDKSVTIVYRFLHDRVQQAAYALIPEQHKQRTHYQIGRCLLDHAQSANQDDHLFDIVNQINLGRNLITHADEQQQLISLNFRAGLKAKSATAYETAVAYFDIALEALPENCWKQHYSLTLTLYENAAEVAYLVGNGARMEKMVKTVSAQAKTCLDTVKTLQTNMLYCLGQNQPLASIKIGRTLLTKWGIVLPEAPSIAEIQQELANFKPFAAQFSFDEIAALPALTDPEKLATVSTLMLTLTPAMITAPNLFFLIALLLTRFSLENGNSPYSPNGYTSYGIFLKNLDQDIDAAYNWGQMAIKLLQTSHFTAWGNRVHEGNSAFITHGKRHVEETLDPLQQAYSSSLDNGDFEYAGYSIFVKCYHLYFLGRELSDVRQAILKATEALSAISQNLPFSWNQCFYQTVLKLSGDDTDPNLLLGEAFDAETYVRSKQEQGDVFGLCYFYFNQATQRYILGEYPQALEASDLAEQYLAGPAGMLTEVVFTFYDSLIRLACNQGPEDDHLLAKVSENQQKMRYWAAHAPMNFQHKYDLVCAEAQRISGDRIAAIEFYDLAIAGAKANGYLQEEALANELAAKFYLDWGKEKLATGYMQDAYYGYSRWGAQAKTDQLASLYPSLLEPVLQSKPQHLAPLETRTNAWSTNNSIPLDQTTYRGQYPLSEALDFATVMQSAQLLSSNLELEGLIAQLMKLMLQTSGAETCALVLPQTFQIQAAQEAGSQEAWLVYQLNMDGTDLETVTTDSQESPTLSIPQLLPGCRAVPPALIQYVKRMGKAVQIDGLAHEEFNITDQYLLEQQPQSVLAQPIPHQDAVIGVLYLENRTTAKVFNPNQRTVIDFFCNQAGIALENARLYQQQTHQAQALRLKNQELQVAKQRAESASRAKSHFLQNVSHELRTPLTGILGYSQILKRSSTLSEKERQGVETIHDCGNNLLKLVDDVIAITQTETSPLKLTGKKVNLPVMLWNVVKAVETKILSRQVQLGCQLSSQLPEWVWVDEARLRQVLLSLLENGIKFTEQGDIRLQVDVVTLTDTQASLNFQVADTGIGISAADQVNLFRLFEQVRNTHTQAGGLGLGLAMSQLIVQEMGSEITVKSQVGQGSQFSFVVSLPLCQLPLPAQIVDVDGLRAAESSAYQSHMGHDVEHTPAEVFIPPPVELQELLKLSKTGRLRKIRQHLEQLQEKDSRYASFVQPILVLEKQFNVDEIEALLLQHLSSVVESS